MQNVGIRRPLLRIEVDRKDGRGRKEQLEDGVLHCVHRYSGIRLQRLGRQSPENWESLAQRA